ncbi:LuxR family two component transcriptional regulator [Aneurinibacillus soli]|uniref:Transcriptional regulatory protein DegU n=1 Tax=Aneurinibacillus soli TaxID=1500254 RepID=A0A0U5AZ94_9BACL|nr:response regulator transcription factor [Aneurinibacillus soli]PYE57790.1 LuxR family two component transcriptional regulator [Aneurinibacillus soli]BAU26255.1 Transcriptional regulatory protein DegU [Aneurinibacillus soli]
MNKPIRILIADDQTLMREGLKTILELEDDIEVIGTPDDGKKAYEMVAKHHPDLVLMDVRMPVMDGIESTRLIKKQFPETVVLILTTFAEDAYIIEGLANGASGFLLKDIHGDRLISSIRDAACGQLLLPSIIATKLATRLSQLSSQAQHEINTEKLRQEGIEFSAREKEIARLMLKGFSNRQIAKALFISEGTVKNYISIIYSKIGTNERTKAIMYIQTLGIEESDTQ